MLQDEETLARLMKQDAAKARNRIKARDENSGWRLKLDETGNTSRIKPETLVIAAAFTDGKEYTARQVSEKVGIEFGLVASRLKNLSRNSLIRVARAEVSNGARYHIYEATGRLKPWLAAYGVET